MSSTLRLVLIALIGILFAGCLIPVPVPGWHDRHGDRRDRDDDDHYRHHHDRDSDRDYKRHNWFA